MLRRLGGMLRNGAVMIGWLYALLALVLLDLMDAGIVRSAAAAWKIPWLEKACWYFSIPGVIGIFVFLGWVLIRECLERRKTRREARRMSARPKSEDSSRKES